MSVNPPRPVRLLSRYVMLETLGKGGFSKVKLGLDPSTNPPTRVALKILTQSSLSATPASVEAVRREIHAMRVVQHRHVLTLRDVLYDVPYPKKDGTSYPVILIVLDLAVGGELFDVLAYTGAFDEVLARTYFHQLVDAVGFCHARGVCHRDLKPENLLLDDQFALLVSDFGLSHSLQSETGQRQLLYTTCGTMAYIAPEVLTGRRRGYDGAAADVWSCGVILFILVASFPPFQQPSVDDWWFNKLATGRPHLFWAAHVRTVPFSEGLQRFLTRLLEVDPQKRMGIGEMLQDEWFCGETLSAERLNVEVRRRKEDLDVRKMQERADRDRQRRQQEVAGRSPIHEVTSIRSLDDEDPYRTSADSATERLPPTQPAMALGTLDGEAGGEEVQSQALMSALQQLDDESARPPPPRATLSSVRSPSLRPKLGGAMPVSRLFRSRGSSPSPSALPPKPTARVPVYDPTLTVPTLTLLSSSLGRSELHKRLMSLLSLHRFTVKYNEESHRYKAAMQTPMGEVVLTIQIWRREENDSGNDEEEGAGHLLLEFRRHAGDSGQYREIFTGLVHQMTNRGILSTDTPTGVPAS